MLLPPGLVFEDPAAYAKLAVLPVVPWEDIHKLWNNSTSRYKKFQDPTSCRLEHFWWHVWASDRRELSGKTLARLWQDIATGPTIAPLIGPPRPRPMPHTRSMHESDRTGSSDVQHPEGTQQATASLQEKLAQNNLTPSSSRPPPAHPILKKPRGPSTSGPRPTARFVDVPDSEDDTRQQSSDSVQTGSGSGSGSGTSQADTPAKKQTPARSKSPAPKGEKKTSKKFVASKVPGKRRPVLPRRQSSQSSAGSVASDTSSRDGKAATTNQASQQVFLRSPTEATFSESQGSYRLPTHDEEPVPSSRTLKNNQAAESDPAKPTIVRTSPQPDLRSGTKATASKRTPSPLTRGYNAGEGSPGTSGSSTVKSQQSAKKAGKQPEILGPGRKTNPLGIYDTTGPVATLQTDQATAEQPILSNRSTRSEEASSTGPESQKPPSPQEHQGTAPRMARTRSNESKRMSVDPVPSSFFKSPSVVGMSKLAVKGGFDFEVPRPRPSEEDLPPLGVLDPDIPKASVLDSKFTPTQPTPTAAPAPAMARSKSQLTLLLELDKERSERNRSSSGASFRGGSKDNGKQRANTKK